VWRGSWAAFFRRAGRHSCHQASPMIKHVLTTSMVTSDGDHTTETFSWPMAPLRRPDMNDEKGFTLIELSIVLVIIGLIIGGVVVGRELINAATIRAQITQIEKYNTAVHTFQLKYGELPGDMSPATAAACGFATRSGAPGQGDGNGIIMGPNGSIDSISSLLGAGLSIGGGEVGLFWNDLSQAGLVDGSFTAATYNSTPDINLTDLGLYLPPAKIGNGNYVMAMGIEVHLLLNRGPGNSWIIAQLTGASAGTARIGTTLFSSMTVMQTYSIDQKMDDGRPFTGNVWSFGINDGSAVATPLTCVDFGGNPVGVINYAEYSLSIDQGSNANCLIFLGFQ
jgi:prepilin-type N-terminal cleavage/methylation domain-containing protein